MDKNLFAASKEPNNYRERVLLDDARKILLFNETVIVHGIVRYFCIAELSLGVYEIGLAATSVWRTEVVKYIPSLNADGTKIFPYL